MQRIVIIGNGISGITCARHLRKLGDDQITVISSETDHFFSRTALMYIYMGHMTYENTKPYEDWFWDKNKIDLVRDYVERIDVDSKSLKLQRGSTIQYDLLVIATGSKPNKFGWPGQDLDGVQGLYSYQDLELMETNTQDIEQAAIVGGGLIGVEMAEMLLSRNIPVTFIIREKEFWDIVLPPQEAAMISRHIGEHHVELIKEVNLQEVIGDDSGRIQAVKLDTGQEIECQYLGLTVGVTPNIQFLKDSAIELDRGVLVDHYFETNQPGIYAIGDCAQFREPLPGRKPVEQVWYTGRMHGETLARTLSGERTTYRPGNWFNSAKFFDIEYQVYGDIKNVPPDDETHLYWEHSSGKKSIRIALRKTDEVVIGLNLMGIRYRHEVCDRWLTEQRTIDYVLDHLAEANFDPEFFESHEAEVVQSFRQSLKTEAV